MKSLLFTAVIAASALSIYFVEAIDFVKASECVKVKAAFDIGSGATKMKVARVDTCLQKIDKVLFESHRPVKYKESLLNSPDNTLSKNIQNQGVQAINALKAEAFKFKPDSYDAVATSAFRTAKNGAEAAKYISSNSGVNLKVISQEEEAKVGFVGASRIAANELDKIVVWDIGGGSMQMTSYKGAGKFDIFEGKMASASFKKHVVQKIQGKDPAKIESPNPIGEQSAGKALEDARAMALKSVPEEIKSKIKNGAQVVGIGGVHYYSVKGQTKVDGTYTLNDLELAIKKGIEKSDSDIGGDYASTDVTNLILVKGFMESLGIKEVSTGKINLADGVLLGGVPK